MINSLIRSMIKQNLLNIDSSLDGMRHVIKEMDSIANGLDDVKKHMINKAEISYVEDYIETVKNNSEMLANIFDIKLGGKN